VRAKATALSMIAWASLSAIGARLVPVEIENGVFTAQKEKV